MNTRLIAAVLAVVAILAVITRATRRDAEDAAPTGRLVTQRAELAWMGVEGIYGGIYDAGYARYTASQLASLMADAGNAAQSVDPQDAGGGRPAPKPIPYVLGRPTASWQIVLVPYDDRSVVRVELYGADLNKPLKSAEYSAR